MHVVGVQREQAPAGGVDLAREAVLHPLSDHRALLAWNREQVGVDVRQDRLAERAVEILGGPPVMRARELAQLEMIDLEALRQHFGFALERRRGIGIRGRHAAVHRERQRHESIAEQAAPHVRERQHAFDRAGTLGIEEVRVVPEHLRDHVLPRRAVEERRVGAAQHERIPARGDRGIVRTQAADRETARRGGSDFVRGMLHGPNVPRNAPLACAAASVRR